MADDAVRTALFLDFDNVYGALFDIDPDKADLFGRRPEVWLRFFVEGRHDGRPEDETASADDTIATVSLPGSGRGSAPRRAILMRNCYLNPDGRVQGERQSPQFYQYRRNFVSAGFSVIDCPNLTSRGKNAADIRMALDIVDAIDHATRFDEFIVLAVDSDMTPVLVRLRAHDRRSTVFATKMMSPAYRAACDLLVGEIDFVNRALGFAQALPPTRPTDRITPLRQEEQTDLLQHIAGEVAAYVRGRGGPIPVRQTLPVLTRFPTFTRPVDGKRWFGYPSMAALFVELARREAAIKLVRTADGDMLISVDAPMPAMEAAAGAVPTDGELQHRIVEAALRALAAQTNGMLLSLLGTIIRKEMPDLPPKRWPGGGQLQELLRRANDSRITLGVRDKHPMAILTDHAAAAIEALLPAPAVVLPAAAPEAEMPEVEAGQAPEAEPAALPDQTMMDVLAANDLRNRLVSYVRGILTNEDEPIDIGELERLVLAQHDIGGWPGAATFAEFLQRQQIDILPVATGFVYDRQRHDPFTIVVREGDEIGALSAPCRALIDLVTRNTRCPALTPRSYRDLFGAIAAALADDEQFARANREPANLARAVDAVEAECREAAITVSADDIAYVVDALRDNDAVIRGADKNAVLALADAYAEYLQALCADNRLMLTDEERTLLRLWIGADEINEDGN